MGLWNALRNELIDIIEWTDSSNDTMVYRFERHDNEIKMGAKLTVRESQVAVFVNEGTLADVFTPGMYTLTTQNIPVLATLKGWKYGFDSPYKAEVYFVNTKQFTDQKWGTKSPVTVSDPRFGMLEIRAFGTFATRVVDAKQFLKEVVGTDGHFTTEEIAGQLRSMVVTRLTSVLGQSGLTADAFAGKIDELSQFCQERVDKECEKYGLKITSFLIENISMPDEVKKEIFELSRLGKIDMHQLGQLKAAKAIEKAAENPSGMAGAGMGMGAGYVMAQHMGHMFASPAAAAPVAQTPPPLPQAAACWYVAVQGKQAGPFDASALVSMVQSGQLTQASLVWKQGQAQWLPASQVPETAALFAAVPPPLPMG